MAYAPQAGNGTRDKAAKRGKDGMQGAAPIAGTAHTLHTTERGKRRTTPYGVALIEAEEMSFVSAETKYKTEGNAIPDCGGGLRGPAAERPLNTPSRA